MEYYRGSNEPKMQLAEWHFDGMCDLDILNTLKYKSTLKNSEEIILFAILVLSSYVCLLSTYCMNTIILIICGVSKWVNLVGRHHIFVSFV